MSGRIVVVGAPTALGGHLSGMERTPAGLRALGLLDRVGRLVPDGALDDAGDLSIEPGFRPDPDRRTKNREPIAAFLPRLAERVAWALGPGGDPRVGDAGGRDRRTGGHPPPSPEGPGDRSASTERRADSRLLLLGGDCTTHAGALAGLRRAHPGRTFGLAWFDAHGDFNTPDTTPSGNVWGMPFAMICGRGDPLLVAAAAAPSVREEDAALVGGQVLDELESRALAASPVAHFGAGMVAREAGLAALAAWARVVARRVDAFYVAFDADCLDAAGVWAVAMPEPGGLSLDTALAAIAAVRAAGPIAGFGATGIDLAGGDAERTVGAVARLAAAALG